MRPHSQQILEYDVVVLGAGFSGSFTAETLARSFPGRVALVEAGDEVLGQTSSSANECFKLHTGVHYVGDETTALLCLHNSVVMANFFGEYILDADNPRAPTRRGRHYLMSNSAFGVKKTKAICQTLKDSYRQLVAKYPKAKRVFGEPDNFITYLNPKDYPYVAEAISFEDKDHSISREKVILGIETPECQIDLSKFKQYFKNVFLHHSDNLDLLLNHKIIKIREDTENIGYRVRVVFFDPKTRTKQVREIRAKCVVNCTWNNIELFDRQLGIYPEREVVNRLKVLVRVNLPKSLRNMNTCIFFAGPHASITRLWGSKGEMQALLTYEPKTNAGFYRSGTSLRDIPDPKVRELMRSKLDPARSLGKEYAREIILGASRYIPDLAYSVPVYVGLGYVKNYFMPSPAYLYDPKSPHHTRREDGLEQKKLGYITFSGMKMTYTFQVAQRAVHIVKYHLLIRKIVILTTNKLLSKIISQLRARKLYYHPYLSAITASLKNDVPTLLMIDVNNSDQYSMAHLTRLLKNLSSDFDHTFSPKILERIIDQYVEHIESKRANTHLFSTTRQTTPISGNVIVARSTL